MKRIIIICIGLLATITAMAQQGLNINSLFNEKLITDEWVTQELNGKTEIIVTGNKAKELGLTTYHSISVTGKAKSDRSAIERLVIKDGAQAIDKEMKHGTHSSQSNALVSADLWHGR